MLAVRQSRKRRDLERKLVRIPRNLLAAVRAAASRFGVRRLRATFIVAVVLWFFCDFDSYPLWILWWGPSGPPPPDPLLTHGCVEPNYALPLAVVMPLIAAQMPRLIASMKLWGTPEGLPCTSPPSGDLPHLLFYFDRPLDERGVTSAARKIRRFTEDNLPLRNVLRLCFANVSFTSAALSASDTQNSQSFDVFRNLASTRGSNNQFWKAFSVHRLYRHMFYMEPDTWPLKADWLRRIDALSRDEAIWMRGTLMRYQPRMVVAPEPFRSAYTRHINGNALYELHDPCFARYRQLVQADYDDAAFDVAMAQYRMPRYQYRLEHAVAHRFTATNVIADMGVEQFASVEELRAKLPGTYLAHAKFNYVSKKSF